MRRTVDQAIQWLRAQPEGADAADDLTSQYLRIRSRATLVGWALVIGLIAVGSVTTFFVVVRDDLDSLGEVMKYWWHLALLSFAMPLQLLLPVAIVAALLVVALFHVRGLYVRYRLCRYLDTQVDAGCEVTGARQIISTTRVEVLYRLVSLLVPVVLLLTGLAWAALIWIGTNFALNCAKSSKCL